jgi:hypothetical protein
MKKFHAAMLAAPRILCQRGIREQGKALGSLSGQAGKNHGYMVAGVASPSTINHDPRAIDHLVVTGMELEGHLGPWLEGRGAAELDAVAADKDGIFGEV